MTILLGVAIAAAGALMAWGGVSGRMAAIFAAIFDRKLLSPAA